MTIRPIIEPGWLKRSSQDKDYWYAGGQWNITNAQMIECQLQTLFSIGDPAAAITFDISAVSTLDTTGAWLLQRTVRRLQGMSIAVNITNLDPVQQALLNTVDKAEAQVPLEPKQGLKAVDIINQLGYAISSFVVEAMSLINFFGMITIALLQIAVFRRRVHWTPLFYHMEQIGLNAILVIGLLSFLIGVVLAFQGVDQLRRFGAELLIVNLLGVSILRELGILMTAIVVAGRSGSAFTAQIGTMQVNQEIDAMRTLGLDPVDRLVTPRILALVLTLPLLTFYADIVSLVGGATMCYFKLGISLSQFVFQLHSAVTAEQLMVGIIKAPVFALTIAIVGCYEGFQVSGNTESVGKLTTKAVVESIFLVVLFDALFSILFSALGI